MTIEIKDFYLNTPSEQPGYLRMKLTYFPDDVIDQYNTKDRINSKGFVYVKVVEGMYCLQHTGIIAQKLLEKRLNDHGFHHSKFTPRFWKQASRPICFSLVVDDFASSMQGKKKQSISPTH